MIFRVLAAGAPWVTVVVRARDRDEAQETVRPKMDDYDVKHWVLEELDPDGPAGVLIEDVA